MQQMIRKSNELIEARYRLSIWEQRLVLTLLTQISPHDEDFKRYKINIADLARLWQLTEGYTAFYEEVQNAADSLVGKTIQLSDDPTTSETVSWLAYVKYKRGSGVIEMEFHNSLKPYMIQLQRHFTQYQLGHVINFRNQYTIRIYELLKMEVFKHPTGTFSKQFSYEELRVFLAVGKKEYALFADFKKRIIEPSVKEISNHSDLLITQVQYDKTGRKITDITFTVKTKPSKQVFESHTLHADQPVQPAVATIAQQLIALGFTAEAAHYCQKTYSTAHIERNIAYVKAKQQQGLVNDFPAYLNKAIKDDLGSAWEAEQAKQTTEQEQRKITAQQRELELTLREERSQRENDLRMQQLLKEQGKDASFDQDELALQLQSLIKVKMQKGVSKNT